jgi:hypothetical protein
MARAACLRVINSQGSEFRQGRGQGALSWVRALFSPACQATRQPELLQRDEEEARDARLTRADALREAALSLSLGDGIALTGRDYQLLEQLWRTDR